MNTKLLPILFTSSLLLTSCIIQPPGTSITPATTTSPTSETTSRPTTETSTATSTSQSTSQSSSSSSATSSSSGTIVPIDFYLDITVNSSSLKLSQTHIKVDKSGNVATNVMLKDGIDPMEYELPDSLILQLNGSSLYTYNYDKTTGDLSFNAPTGGVATFTAEAATIPARNVSVKMRPKSGDLVDIATYSVNYLTWPSIKEEILNSLPPRKEYDAYKWENAPTDTLPEDETAFIYAQVNAEYTAIVNSNVDSSIATVTGASEHYTYNSVIGIGYNIVYNMRSFYYFGGYYQDSEYMGRTMPTYREGNLPIATKDYVFDFEFYKITTHSDYLNVQTTVFSTTDLQLRLSVKEGYTDTYSIPSDLSTFSGTCRGEKIKAARLSYTVLSTGEGVLDVKSSLLFGDLDLTVNAVKK